MNLKHKSHKAGLGVLPDSPSKHTLVGRGSAPAREMAAPVLQVGGMSGRKPRRGVQGDADNRHRQRSNATGRCSRGYLGCSLSPSFDRLDPVSSRSPRHVSGAARRRRKPHEPAGEKVQGGAGGAAGEGDKAHPAGTRGRTAAAWRSSLGCPSWSPHPGTLFEPGVVPQTEQMGAAASSGWWLSQAV